MWYCTILYFICQYRESDNVILMLFSPAPEMTSPYPIGFFFVIDKLYISSLIGTTNRSARQNPFIFIRGLQYNW